MGDLSNPIVHRIKIGRMWRGLTIVLLVLAVALPATTPVMATSCNPRLECEFSDGQVHWTALGLHQGAWKVKWFSPSGNGEKEFSVGKDCDSLHPGCCEFSGSFRHKCGDFTVQLFQGTGPDSNLKWHLKDTCKGEGCEKDEKKEEEACTRADVSAIVFGVQNGVAVNATVGGTPQPTLFTALDAFGRPAVLWTFFPPPGETWTVVVTPQLPAGLSPEEWRFEPTSRTVEIQACSQHQVTFQLINIKREVTVVLPVTGGEAAGTAW